MHVIGVVGHEYSWTIGKTRLLLRNIHSTLLSLFQDVKLDHGTFFGRWTLAAPIKQRLEMCFDHWTLLTCASAIVRKRCTEYLVDPKMMRDT